MKQILLFAAALIITLSSFAQFTFVHLSDMHVSNIPFENSDTNAQYFQCYIKEFAKLTPKPAFVVSSGDESNVGNQVPNGMYPTFTQYLYPPSQTNPGIGDYFIDSAQTIPIYFVPGNHEYWEALVNPPVSNDTLKYYTEFLIPDTDYCITTNLAVIVFLRSGSDTAITQDDKKGKGLSDSQCNYLRNILTANSSKRKIIVMHHPAVNAVGTNSDGTPFTEEAIPSPDFNSIANNRTTFLNICDSNHVDVVLNGHMHQNVDANRAGHVISENGLDSTRYVQTAAGFNRSYRIITVNPMYVNVSVPLRSCNQGASIDETSNSLNVSIFPNPATNMLTVKCNKLASIEISNIEGQIINFINETETNNNIDLTGLQKGVYFIKVKTDDKITVKKFIIQ